MITWHVGIFCWSWLSRILCAVCNAGGYVYDENYISFVHREALLGTEVVVECMAPWRRFRGLRGLRGLRRLRKITKNMKRNMTKTNLISNKAFKITETRRAHSAGPNKCERASSLVETGKKEKGEPEMFPKYENQSQT